ncbi:MAG: DUF1648 domain-containing protein [Acidimicrobiia bacterium]|nr:DUF1648 domain-containing protein [Acidimicrobiia bacterium]MDX2468234.1 DUF1648 domain-containing protein [Acidimicrobiia bacterium]
MKASKWLTLGVVPLIIYGSIIAPFVLFWSDLPNPMASHWSLAGNADGAMPPIILLALLVAIAAAVHVAVVRVVARTPVEAASFVAGLYVIGAVLAGVGWLSVLANRDQGSWEAADGVGLLQILVLVAVAGVAGFVGWVLVGGRSVDRPDADRPMLDVAEPGHAVWASRGTGKLFYVVGAVLIVAGLATWGWSTVVLIVIGIVIVTFAEVRTTVSSRGVIVSMGWLGIPSWTVPLSSLTAAEIEVINPMSYGGWGYRIRPGVRAVISRGGEAIRLVRTDKADLVLTVDDAETGAGLINSMLGAQTL